MAPPTSNKQITEPEAWYVLVCALPISGDCFDLGSSLRLRRLVSPLSVFDLAAVGAAGFREWAILEPLATVATAEITSPTNATTESGYDALNKCWLVSALLVLRGFARHVCPAVSAYSWNLIAGHQAKTVDVFHKQLQDEGIDKAVHESRRALPSFQGGLLDYHLRIFVPRNAREGFFDETEAEWIRQNFDPFNALAADDERFRFALEAAVDWRYAKDPRAGIARLWAGIESLFGISTEIVHRISLLGATVLAQRGPDRLIAYRRIKTLYGIRSKAVHGEPLPEEKLVTGLQDSFEVLRLLLLDAVERRAVRTEEDYLKELLC
jgi:hypothetical protein